MKKTKFTFNASLSTLLFLFMWAGAFGQIGITLEFNAQGFPEEVGWTLYNTATNTVYDCEAADFAVPNPTVRNMSVPAGTYQIRGYDAFGDGWNGSNVSVRQGTFALVNNATLGGGGGTNVCNGTPGTGAIIATFNVIAPTCFITCPANITVNNSPGQCGANVTVPQPVLTGMCTSFATTNLMTQDFNAGVQPAGWTVSFTGGGGNTGVSSCSTPGLFHFNCTGAAFEPNGPPAGSTGTYAVINDDDAGSGFLGNGIITSPVIGQAPVAGDTYRLRFGWSFRASGSWSAEVWNGAAWISVASGNATAQGTVDANVTAHMNPNFQVRFVHNDLGFWAWAFGFDNVIVDRLTPIPAAATNSFNNSTNASGFYPVGTTNVVWTVLDPNGIPAMCSHTVTVNDVEAPVFTECPGNLIFNLLPGECEIQVTYNVSAVDNCPPMTLVYPFGPQAGTIDINCGNGALVTGNTLTNNHFRTFTIPAGSGINLTSVEVGVRGGSIGNNFTVNVYQQTGAFPGGTQTLLSSSGLFALTAACPNCTVSIPMPQVYIAPGTVILLELAVNAQPMRFGFDYGAGQQPTWLTAPDCGANLQLTNTLGLGDIGLRAQISGFAGALDLVQLPTVPPNPYTTGDFFPIGTWPQLWQACDGVTPTPNCSQCSFNVVVNPFTNPTRTLACNNNVQISLDEDGCSLVGADQILEGGPYACYNLDYTVTRVTPLVGNCGPLPYPGAIWVNCFDIGKTITVKVTDNATGSFCWGTIRVEDKLAPVITCEDIIINCSEALQYNTPVNSLSKADFQGPSPAFDATTREFPLDISAPANATVTDVNVRMRIDHEWVNDLDVFLISPAGTIVSLFQDACPNSNNNVEVTIDDQGSPFVCSSNDLTIKGRLQPQGFPGNQLATFNGENARGQWILRVTDDTGADAAIVQNIVLDVRWTGFFEQPVATDNCGIASLTYASDNDDATCSTSGVILRTWTAKDASGHTATCQQTITIRQNRLEDIDLPQDVYLDCTSPYPAINAPVIVKDTFVITGPITINDNGTTSVAFDFPHPLSSTRLLRDVNVRIVATHSNVSQLTFWFQQLDGNGNVVRFNPGNRPGVKLFSFYRDYVKCSNATLSGLDINFDDEGCALPHEPCLDYAPTILGQFQPQEALSALDGRPVNNVNGPLNTFDWRIFVQDSVANAGAVQNIQRIEIVYTYEDPTLVQGLTIANQPVVNGDNCNISYTFKDEQIDICPSSYKVLRTFSIVDWCTQERQTYTQLIKVLDSCPPVITGFRTRNNDDDALQIAVTRPANNNNGAHGVCYGDVVVPPVQVCYENCSGVSTAASTRLYSADGLTLIAELSTNGGVFTNIITDLDEGTFLDPPVGDFCRLFLPEPDALYQVKYTLEDNCGNKVNTQAYIRVIDRVPPTPICRQITKVSLNTTTSADLCAALLDEGSSDNCGGVHYYVRRMINPNDVDPTGASNPNNPLLKAEIPGRPGVCPPQYFTEPGYKYVKCTQFTCDDIGQDNQVFLLVVDDYVQNYIDNFILQVFQGGCPPFAAIADPCQFPFTILPDGSFYLARDFEYEQPVTANPWNFVDPGNFIPELGEEGILAGNTASIWEGHYNFCMVEVLVEDKVRPNCVAPKDIWATCDTIPANTDLSDTTTLQNLFGNAVTVDNCGSWTRELAPDVDVDICGVGTVTRRWTARDRAGNTSLGLCRQIIQIMPKNLYRIDVPDDFEGECRDVAASGLTASGQACDLLAISHKDDTLVAALPFCYKVIRTWKIINWCEYNGFDDPTILPRVNTDPDLLFDRYTVWSNGDYLYVGASINDPTNRIVNVSSHRGPFLAKNPANTAGVSNGYYEYEQHIKVYDNRAPVLTDTLSGPFCGGERDEDPCTGLVNLLPQIVEDCGQVDLTRVTWQLDAFSSTFVTADFSGTNRLNARYPLGTHTVRFRVPDDCGNTSQIDITFDVIDCKAPTPVCINGLSVALMPTGMVEIWAVDFDASSFDYCHPIIFRVNRVVDLNGNGLPDANELRTTPPTTDSIVVRCPPRTQWVQLWVGEQSSDNVNNWDYCVTFIEIQDPNGACGSNPGSKIVGGKVANESGQSVSDVTVELSGQMVRSVVTGNDGNYRFNGLTPGGDYTVTPNRDDDPLNGVTTFDLVLISKHILNVQRLDSPYKIIAADANNSGQVTTFDLVALRKLILRVDDQLPNNTSWRFVDKSFAFQNVNDPWVGDRFREVRNFNNLTLDQLNADFVAIKVGDVNGSAKPNQLSSVDDRSYNETLVLSTADQSVKAGKEFRVSFTAGEEVMGYQFTMEYDSKSAEVVAIEEGLAKAENFHVIAEQGVITTSWNEDVSTQGKEMFTLVLRAKADIKVSEVLGVSSSFTAAEAYTKTGEPMNVALNFGNGVVSQAGFALYQNTPNPFKELTTIGFNLPEASTATLTITDVSGKVLKVVKAPYAKGYNEVVLKRSELGVSNGVLSYRIETGNHTATRKMIIIE